MENLRNRLSQFVRASMMTERGFAIKCGITPYCLSNYIDGKRKVSMEAILKVLNEFPSLSSEWLLRGDGKMLKKNNDVEILRFVDVICSLQDKINEQQKTIKQLETQLKLK